VWLRVEEAEAELARSLGRGERVKLHSRAALLAACWPVRDDSAGDDIVSGASASGDSAG
jgi:ferredoxin--NADP+ reductase